MKLFPVFHPPCLFVVSAFFWGGGVFSNFLFRMVTYLEFYTVRYPYHLSLSYYSITYPAYVTYIFQILNRNVFSFFASFLTL